MVKSTAMQNFFSFFLILIGGGLVVYCYFLPWVEVNLVIKKIVLSGLGLTAKSMVLALVPLLALLTWCSNIFWLLRKKVFYRILTIAGAILGVVFTILIIVQMRTQLQDWIEKVLRFQYRFGIIGVLTGFLVQLIGALLGKISAERES